MSSRDEAINLLSFDGGGVRGVSSLVIMHEIMVRIKEKLNLDEIPKPCDYFHLIAGTSTGGLIAIMLGRLRMSTEEALREYDRCAAKVFSFRNKKWTTVTEKFRATALQEVVEDLVRRRNMGEDLLDYSLDHDSKGQCFVCAMPANHVGQPRLLRSYAADCRNTMSGADIKIWEAARATTAASYFFKPMKLRVGYLAAEDFIDATIGYNDPAEVLLNEAADRIGTGRRLGCLISIGTGTRQVRIDRSHPGLRNIKGAVKFGKELLGLVKNTATSGEGPHDRLEARFRDHPNAYFRFNVPDVAAEVKSHHYLKMDILKTATRAYLSDPKVARQVSIVADVLARDLSEHNLTLGHIDGIDKELVAMVSQEAQQLGVVSRFFTGRKEILARIDACFAERETDDRPRREFLLYGLGGVGKTQIALKAAENLANRFKYIFEIDGTNSTTTNQSYASICQDYCPRRGTVNELKAQALRWIEGLSEEWLMIYDNYSEKQDFRPLLPRRNRGNIIYTSRSQGFLSDLPPECVCEVKPLEEEEAASLLLNHAGRGESKLDAQELQAVREIVVEVGCLPLAIASAGAYLKEGECRAVDYLEMFRDRRNRSQLLKGPDPGTSPLPAKPPVYTAFDLSYDAILALRRRHGRAPKGLYAQYALQILNLLCFYHNEGIPVSMIRRAAEERREGDGNLYEPFWKLARDPCMDPSDILVCNFDDTWHSGPFFRGLDVLERFSLVTPLRKVSRVSMHVIVQSWAQDRMDEPTRCRQALAAKIVLLESIRPGWNRAEQSWLQRHLPRHVDACLKHPAAAVDDERYQAELDFKLGWYYNEQKKFDRAVECFQSAMHFMKLEYGAHSPRLIHTLLLVGSSYLDMGRAGDAVFACLEAVDRIRACISDVCEDLEKSGNLARRWIRRQSRCQRLLLLSPPKESDSMNFDGNQAGEGTWVPPESATKAIKEAMGAADPKGMNTDISWAYSGLYRALMDQGMYDAAAESLKLAISFMTEASHPKHIEVMNLQDEYIRRFENGGDIEHWYKRFDMLDGFSERMRERYACHEYSFVLPIGYARALMEAQLWETAHAFYYSTFRAALVMFGVTDHRTLYVMRAMTLCQLKQGFFEEAEHLACNAVEQARASYGQLHLQTAKCLFMLSRVICAYSAFRGPGTRAFAATEEAYDLVRLAFAEDHPLAETLKKNLDYLRSSDDGKISSFSDNFREHMDKIFEEYRPGTEEERIALIEREYREYARKRYQDEARKSRVKALGNVPDERVVNVQRVANQFAKRPLFPRPAWEGTEMRKMSWSPMTRADMALFHKDEVAEWAKNFFSGVAKREERVRDRRLSRVLGVVGVRDKYSDQEDILKQAMTIGKDAF
ncbi:hypothetical protein VTK26DRAFT_6942 [Humicola hyalothermophila]